MDEENEGLAKALSINQLVMMAVVRELLERSGEDSRAVALRLHGFIDGTFIPGASPADAEAWRELARRQVETVWMQMTGNGRPGDPQT